MKNPSYVYLCGGINGLNDSQCKDWRQVAKSLLVIPTLDPMRRDYRGIEGGNVNEIVHGDIRDLESSEFVLVNATRPSWGTAMEVRAAWSEYGLTVVSFVEDSKVSPWLAYHSSRIVKTVEEGAEVINNLYSERAKYDSFC